ncbi:Hypothetical protein D9617_5g068320 [Elsinoe fawcettii]|nr:Hypothetical protein D9617_5g068320 [Elsinoe fawcettii]
MTSPLDILKQAAAGIESAHKADLRAKDDTIARLNAQLKQKNEVDLAKERESAKYVEIIKTGKKKQNELAKRVHSLEGDLKKAQSDYQSNLDRKYTDWQAVIEGVKREYHGMLKEQQATLEGKLRDREHDYQVKAQEYQNACDARVAALEQERDKIAIEKRDLGDQWSKHKESLLDEHETEKALLHCEMFTRIEQEKKKVAADYQSKMATKDDELVVARDKHVTEMKKAQNQIKAKTRIFNTTKAKWEKSEEMVVEMEREVTAAKVVCAFQMYRVRHLQSKTEYEDSDDEPLRLRAKRKRS